MFSENILHQAMLSEKYNANTLQVFYDELLKLDKNYNNLLKLDNQTSPIVMQVEKIDFENINKDDLLALINDLQREKLEVDYNSVRKYLMIYPSDYLKLREMFENILEEIKKLNKKNKPAYEVFSENNGTHVDESLIKIYNELVTNLKKMYETAPIGYKESMLLLFGIKYKNELNKIKESKVKYIDLDHVISESIGMVNTNTDIRRGRILSRFVYVNEQNLSKYFENPEKFKEYVEAEQKSHEISNQIDQIYNALAENVNKWYKNTDKFNQVSLPILFGIKYYHEVLKIRHHGDKKFTMPKFIESTINVNTWKIYTLLGFNLRPFVEVNEEELENYFLEQESIKKAIYEIYKNTPTESDSSQQKQDFESQISNNESNNQIEKNAFFENNLEQNSYSQNTKITNTIDSDKQFFDPYQPFIFRHQSYKKMFEVEVSFVKRIPERLFNASFDEFGKLKKIEIDIRVLKKYEINKDTLKLFGNFLTSVFIVEDNLKLKTNGKVRISDFRNMLTEVIKDWDDDSYE